MSNSPASWAKAKIIKQLTNPYPVHKAQNSLSCSNLSKQCNNIPSHTTTKP